MGVCASTEPGFDAKVAEGPLMHVHVKSAQNLKNSDWSGKIAPYVVLTLMKDGEAIRTEKTKVLKEGSAEPIWDEQFEFFPSQFEKLLDPEGAILKFAVRDNGSASDNDLGHMDIDLAQMKKIEGWQDFALVVNDGWFSDSTLQVSLNNFARWGVTDGPEPVVEKSTEVVEQPTVAVVEKSTEVVEQPTVAAEEPEISEKAEAPCTSVIKEGLLEKRSRWVREWESRYFVLCGDKLKYYMQKPENSDDPAKGTFSLVGGAEAESKGSSAFCLRLKNDNILLACQSEEEQTEWLSAINKAAGNAP